MHRRDDSQPNTAPPSDLRRPALTAAQAADTQRQLVQLSLLLCPEPDEEKPS
jgi:hypothetical protein